MTTTSRLYSLSYNEVKAYTFSALFVAGNIVLPQICHLVPQGGLIWLPIYFFTLIAAYKYGIKVGLLTAILSPLLNSMLFGMPAPAMLPVILVKSIMLASAAAASAQVFKKVSLVGVLLAVVAYQLIGSIVEFGITGSITAALQDVKLGLPGIITQIIGGYLILRYLLKK